MAISFLAQEHHIALYATVSDGAQVEVEFLPLKARQRRALLAKFRFCAQKGVYLYCATRRSWRRGIDSMALQAAGENYVQVRR